MKMTPEENAAYMKAFQESKATTVKERMAAGQAAIAAMKANGAMEAVDQGIKDADPILKMKNRTARIDAAVEGKLKK